MSNPILTFGIIIISHIVFIFVRYKLNRSLLYEVAVPVLGFVFFYGVILTALDVSLLLMLILGM